MTFSPPPKYVDETGLYKFQEESAARVFMRGAFFRFRCRTYGLSGWCC